MDVDWLKFPLIPFQIGPAEVVKIIKPIYNFKAGDED